MVGPNRAFLHYIAQVLPALGEGGIEQSTVDELVGRVAVKGLEPVESAILKGDARMADVLRRAVFSHVARPTEDVVAIIGTKRYRIPEHRLRRYVDDARRADVRWSCVRDRLRQQVAEDVRRQREDVGGAPSDAETARIARSREVREFVDAVWPALDAPQAARPPLYADAEFLARCSRTILTDDERALLGPPDQETRWTSADAVLLDELAGLLDGVPSYVHVVVDEAQDLSPMQCRAVARRCPLGSVTVLGDLAQATTPWAPALAGDAFAPRSRRRVDPAADRGYRVPGEVLEVANRLLPHVAADVPPATLRTPGY